MAQPPNDNFYAPPATDTTFTPTAGATIHREGNAVVVPAQLAVLPPRCVRCNQPASKRLLRRLYWHHPALYLLLLVGLCFYLIPALIVRKKAVIEVGLCDRHHQRRLQGILIGWLGFAGSLALTIATMEDYPVVGVFFMFSMIVLPIVGIVMAQVVSATRIDEQRAWLKTGRPFLESIREGVW
ncbi:MAG TPA: hypothetical protein VI197_25425 [Polyangiaceae bacterium]